MKLSLVRKRLVALLSWSTLAAFGNSPLTKLVALAPVVAFVVRLQESILNSYVNFEQWAWLYWSLISIAAGQLLYFLFCPRIIKKYGDDVERFAIESLTAYPLQRAQAILSQRIRSLHGFPSFRLWLDPEASDFEPRFLEAMNQPAQTRPPSDIDRYKRAYSNLWRIVMLAEDDLVETTRFEVLTEMFHLAPRLFSDEGNPIVSMELHDILLEYRASGGGEEQNWKLTAFEWKYDTENRSLPWAVWLTAALYAFGSIYFLWRFIVGLLEMSGLYPATTTALPTALGSLER